MTAMERMLAKNEGRSRALVVAAAEVSDLNARVEAAVEKRSVSELRMISDRLDANKADNAHHSYRMRPGARKLPLEQAGLERRRLESVEKETVSNRSSSDFMRDTNVLAGLLAKLRDAQRSLEILREADLVTNNKQKSILKLTY